MRIESLDREPLSPEQQTLLEQRAERVRQMPEVERTEQLVWLAEFPLGADRYALPLDSLRAAIPLRGITPVPLAPPQVLGILRHGGRTMTAYSLSALLGGRGWAQDPAVLLVVDRGDGGLVALDCEQVPRAVAFPHTLLETARAAGTGVSAPVLDPERRIIHLLDLSRLLAGRRQGS